MTNRVRLMSLLGALALVLAACGGGTSDGDTADLPINDNPAASGGAAGACLEGEPDCQDIGGQQGGEPLPLPSGDEPGADVTSDGMIVEPITVTDARSLDAGVLVAVQGFLFDDGSGPRLCEVLAESVPPQCGENSIPVANYEEMIDVPIQSEQGVSWTDQPVTLLGSIDGGTLVVDPLVTG